MSKEPKHERKRLVSAAALVGVIFASAGACIQDPGSPSPSVYLVTDIDGRHSIQLQSCDEVTEVEVADVADLLAKTDLKFSVHASDVPFELAVGSHADTGSAEADSYLSQLEPPFTLWLQTDEGMFDAYYERWPEAGFAENFSEESYEMESVSFADFERIECS